ncbi:hypothetical protein ABC977_10960 [Thioalkalicoccus limnaeus]|uniref:Uncharacterized protein n=1 Tax=Thioalkalicoccus limnaeus TaxID=120681 RepID=A0ABV4BEG8_9GAMM
MTSGSALLPKLNLVPQSRMHVQQRKRLFQQRIVVEINLSDREKIRRASPSVELAQAFRVKGLGCRGHGLISQWLRHE